MKENTSILIYSANLHNSRLLIYVCVYCDPQALGTKYCYTWIWVDLVQKYVSELFEYSIGELRQQIDEMQLKTDVMRGQIQKFKMLRYALLASVMLGLVLPAGSVAAFSLVGITTLMMFLVQIKNVQYQKLYMCYYFHPSTICIYTRLMRLIDVGLCYLIIGFPCIVTYLHKIISKNNNIINNRKIKQ